jgi:hypothetical protein
MIGSESNQLFLTSIETRVHDMKAKHVTSALCGVSHTNGCSDTDNIIINYIIRQGQVTELQVVDFANQKSIKNPHHALLKLLTSGSILQLNNGYCLSKETIDGWLDGNQRKKYETRVTHVMALCRQRMKKRIYAKGKKNQLAAKEYNRQWRSK